VCIHPLLIQQGTPCTSGRARVSTGHPLPTVGMSGLLFCCLFLWSELCACTYSASPNLVPAELSETVATVTASIVCTFPFHQPARPLAHPARHPACRWPLFISVAATPRLSSSWWTLPPPPPPPPHHHHFLPPLTPRPPEPERRRRHLPQAAARFA